MKLPALRATAFAAALLFASAAHAEDLQFTLTNATGGTIVMFHASPVGVDEWEDDILGEQVLGPGESATVTIADGRDVCEYDMRFDFADEDGLEPLEDTQDLCALGSYTVEE
jgi:hypothetical protein